MEHNQYKNNRETDKQLCTQDWREGRGKESPLPFPPAREFETTQIFFLLKKPLEFDERSSNVLLNVFYLMYKLLFFVTSYF